MSRATRRVRAEDLRDLLEAAPRANIAFRAGETVRALPVAFRFRTGSYLIGVAAAGREPSPGAGDLVELLIDEGQWFFDLRGLRVRGRVTPADTSPEDAAALAWYEIIPEKIVAWDYGTLREVAGGGT